MTTPKERQPLTPRQTEVLEWVAGYIDTHEYPPTLREIASHFRWTFGGAKCHLDAIRRKGRIDWQDGCSRTLRVIGGDA